MRSYRDRRENAIEGADYLKRKAPSAKVEVRDTRDESVTVIGKMQTGQEASGNGKPRPSRPVKRPRD